MTDGGRRRALALLAVTPLVLLAIEALSRPFAPALSEGIHALFAPFCHQDPARTPWAFGHELGACYRCIGLHVGVLAIVLTWNSDRFGDRRAFPILLALGLADWVLCQMGASLDHPIERLIAGGALGAGLALGVVALARALRPWLRRVRERLRMRRSLA